MLNVFVIYINTQFQCNVPQTHQVGSNASHAAKIPGHTRQSKDVGKTRDRSSTGSHPCTDFLLPRCDVPSVPQLHLGIGRQPKSLCGPAGQSRPGVQWRAGTFPSSWGPRCFQNESDVFFCLLCLMSYVFSITFHFLPGFTFLKTIFNV